MLNRKYFLIIPLFAILSCNNSSVEKENKAVVVAETALPATINTSDSLHLQYNLKGSGDTSLVFLHGWSINKTYWDSQLAYFSPRYAVVAVDQAGFGKSDTGRANYSVEQYSDDAAALIDQLHLKNVILIGHSMSGDIILDAALRYPEKVIAIVGIDNFNSLGQPFTPEEKKQYDAFMKIMDSAYRQTVGDYAQQYLFHASTDTTVKKRVKDDFMNTDKRVSMNSIDNSAKYSQKEREQFKKLKYKLYLLNSDANKTDTALLRQYAPASVEVFPIHATGHYPMIEKTADFNRILQEILDKVARGN